MQEPRQLYGLGSLVKKAVRGVKKIVKSPLGKAAIAGAIGFGIPGTSIGGLFGRASFGGAAKGLFGRYGIGATFPSLFANPTQVGPNVTKGFFPKILGKMSTGQKIFTGLGAAAVATPFLQKAFKMGPYEEIAEEVDESYIDPYTAYMMSRYREPGLAFLPNEQYVQPNYYLPQNAAEGGRIGYANGNMVEGEMQLPPEAEEYLRKEYVKYKQQGGDLSYPEFKQMVLQAAAGEQGPEQEEIMTTEAEVVETPEEGIMQMAKGGSVPGTKVAGYTTPAGYNKFDYPSGGKRVAAKEGGLMNLGGLEKDYRTGGFVEIGKEEKADDVPARLSVNEFVFTADAVRNAGDGDIDKGAEVMDNMMKHLEAGGTVSEESQGLRGAQEMYEQSKMLETRIA
tara:strand:+ start:701 stop:1885 length:1185 start_codon:yes stop_codon:yes gene_type:complete